jgi:hypothetical protein
MAEEEEGWGCGAFWIAGNAINGLRKISMTNLTIGFLRAVSWNVARIGSESTLHNTITLTPNQ